MKERMISFPVIQATNLDPFTLNGKRHIGFHYFEYNQSGWLFHWVSEDTDVGWLKTKITEGTIYIFPDTKAV